MYLHLYCDHIIADHYTYLQVFWPSERLENTTVLHLIYCQVVQDVYNNACVRISKDQRVKMKSMLGKFLTACLGLLG